jgi:hypothetical protein
MYRRLRDSGELERLARADRCIGVTDHLPYLMMDEVFPVAPAERSQNTFSRWQSSG